MDEFHKQLQQRSERLGARIADLIGDHDFDSEEEAALELSEDFLEELEWAFNLGKAAGSN